MKCWYFGEWASYGIKPVPTKPSVRQYEWPLVNLVNKSGNCWFSRHPLADKFLHRAIVLVNAYQHTKLQLSSSIIFWDKRVSQNLMCVLQVLGKVKQPTKFQHRSYMYHAVMRICICHRLYIMCTKNGVLVGFEGEDVKMLCSNPQKALPCVNAHLLVYRMSKSV